MTRKKKRSSSSVSSDDNPLHSKVKDFLDSLAPEERDAFFSNQLVTTERRADIWSQQADLGERLVDEYSWAIPSRECLRMFRAFSPVVEIACGANAYWCRFLQGNGIDIVGYDIRPQTGGKMKGSDTNSKAKQNMTHDFQVQQGGPQDLLDRKENHSKTLFLCYPDEMMGDVQVDGSSMSVGEACLHYYQGDTVIHVGELFGDTLSAEQAPWGRSSGPDFQIRLSTDFHCVLQMPLPNWLHVRDTLTVWKRTERCEFVFEADADDEEDEGDEAVNYRYIPKDEQLPMLRAAPKFAHLLPADGDHSQKRARATETVVSTTKKEKKIVEPSTYETKW